MLTATTVIAPPRYLFALLAAANKFGVEVEKGDGDNYYDVSGKADKVDLVLAAVPVLPVATLESEAGEPEGFGTASDLVNGRNVYADLVGKPVYKV